jgi:hypothetical protein
VYTTFDKNSFIAITARDIDEKTPQALAWGVSISQLHMRRKRLGVWREVEAKVSMSQLTLMSLWQ